MENKLTLQKEVTLLESISEISTPFVEPCLSKQVSYIFDLFKNSMKPESWNQKQIQQIIMRLLLLLDQKAFALQYPNISEYKTNLDQVLKDFILKSNLFSTFAKQLNMFFSKKKFIKFQNSINLLSRNSEVIEIFRASILKEIEKDIQTMEKDSKVLYPAAYLLSLIHI